MGLTVVVVVDGKDADEVAAGGDGDNVAVLFSCGDWEEPEALLLEVLEPERFGD